MITKSMYIEFWFKLTRYDTNEGIIPNKGENVLAKIIRNIEFISLAMILWPSYSFSQTSKNTESLSMAETLEKGIVNDAKIRVKQLGKDLDFNYSLDYKKILKHDDCFFIYFEETFMGLSVWGGDLIFEYDDKANLLDVIDKIKRGIPTFSFNKIPDIGIESLIANNYKINKNKILISNKKHIIFPFMELRRKSKAIVGRENSDDYEQVVTSFVVGVEIEFTINDLFPKPIKNKIIINPIDNSVIYEESEKKHFTGGNVWYPGTPATINVNTEYSGNFNMLGTSLSGGGFSLLDMVRPRVQFSAQQTIISCFGNPYAPLSDTNGFSTQSIDNIFGDGNVYTGGAWVSTYEQTPNFQTAPADAFFGVVNSWDMLKNVFGRWGTSGNGDPLQVQTHTGFIDQAWSGHDDGSFYRINLDYIYCYDGYTIGNSFTSPDIIGHEMGHLVLHYTSMFASKYESGGLSEGIPDFFGVISNSYAKLALSTGSIIPATDALNRWTIGSQVSKTGTPFRYFYKPSLDNSSRDSWSQDINGLSSNYDISGPIRRALFFMAQGSTTGISDLTYSQFLPSGMSGIGINKVAKIIYKILPKLVVSSTFSDARSYCISAAQSLYGRKSIEEQAVWNSFASVNVGTPWGG